jgi:outer membrane protein TolC
MAYIQWLQARQAVSIYKNALVLVNENVRVNEKLVRNDVGTNAQVLKAKSEVSKVESSVFEYENNVKNAAAYFNFLRNQSFDAEILLDSTLTELNLAGFKNLRGLREEFDQLKGRERALLLQKKMNENYKIPKIGASLDLGFQGYGFKIWDRQAYGLLGLQIDLPLYTAKSNDLKILQNDIDLKKTQAQTAEVFQQIQLQIQIAQTNLETAKEQFKVNDAELAYAEEYYRLTDKRYAAGSALQIELVDARTQKTAAELKRSLAHFTVLQRMIEIERAEASYPIIN